MSAEFLPIAGEYLHICEFSGNALIDEHDDRIIHCRCFWSHEFLIAQDKKADEIDLGRGTQ